MLYSEYAAKAMDAVIEDDIDVSGFSYLNPSYRVVLEDEGLTPAIITDYDVSWEQVSEMLNLEVERRNKLSNRGRYLVDWLFDIISTVVDPTVLDEENMLIKNVLDYMKLNHELSDKEQSLQQREAELKSKEDVQENRSNIVQLVPGMNFSKRGAH